jgi:hypothetical protein
MRLVLSIAFFWSLYSTVKKTQSPCNYLSCFLSITSLDKKGDQTLRSGQVDRWTGGQVWKIKIFLFCFRTSGTNFQNSCFFDLSTCPPVHPVCYLLLSLSMKEIKPVQIISLEIFVSKLIHYYEMRERERERERDTNNSCLQLVEIREREEKKEKSHTNSLFLLLV